MGVGLIELGLMSCWRAIRILRNPARGEFRPHPGRTRGVREERKRGKGAGQALLAVAGGGGRGRVGSSVLYRIEPQTNNLPPPTADLDLRACFPSIGSLCVPAFSMLS